MIFPIPHLIMFFGMLFIHLVCMPPVMVYSFNHLEFGTLSQIYLGIFMSSCMVLLETLMHPMPLIGWILTIGILIVSIIAYKYQWFISNHQYLREMIPHHSMAILTSKSLLEKETQNQKQNQINRKTKELAKDILKTQETEIQTMKQLLIRQ
jgi:hypothetical protein